MRTLRWTELFTLIAASSLFGGCGLLIGIDGFTDEPGTGGGGHGGTGGTGSGASGGGTGATGGSGGSGGAMSGGGGQGGSGGAPACVPDSTMPCYSGPPDTKNQGICEEGTMTCLPDGSGYGACEGEILPLSFEDCTKGTDDDCDGTPDLEDGCCEIGQPVACYDGPPGTMNVGNCKAGSNICPADGIAPSGPCLNDQTPQQEFCGAPEDEDCNSYNCYVWLVHAGNFTMNWGTAVAGRPFVPDVAMAGDFKDMINVGGGALTANGSSFNDIYLAAYDATGAHKWSKRFGTKGFESVYDMDWGFNTGIVIGGRYGLPDAPLDLGGGALENNNTIQGFAARFGDDGTHVWSRSFSASTEAEIKSVSVVTGNAVIVAGTFKGTMNFGDAASPVSVTSNDYDGFVAKYDSLGKYVSHFLVGGGGVQTVEGAYANFISEDVILMGTTSNANYGVNGTAITGDHYVARTTLAGMTTWAKGFVGGPFATLGANFNTPVYVGVSSNAPVTFGATTLTPTGGSYDIFVAKYDPSNGNIDWTKQIGGAGDEYVDTLTPQIPPVFEVLIGGHFTSSFSFLGTALPNASLPKGGGFLGKIDDLGNPLWVHAMGGVPLAAGWDMDSNAIVTGYYDKQADFGTGSIANSGPDDLFFLKLGK